MNDKIKAKIVRINLVMIVDEDNRFHALCQREKSEELIKEYKTLTGKKLHIFEPDFIINRVKRKV